MWIAVQASLFSPLCRRKSVLCWRWNAAATRQGVRRRMHSGADRTTMSQAGASTHDPLIGSTVGGRYHIEERIGAGAMGAVYRAVQAGLGRPVALKVLKRDLAWGGDTVQRFRREAKAMSALHHPHTVQVFDFGATDDGLLYLAMEMLEGEPITERLARAGVLGVKEAVIYAQEVLRSVGEAHAKGIVHRDLKPDNIFLARVEGEALPMVKVLDFGIAKAIEGERRIDQFETLDGTVFGTPRYMAPEQAAGKALDPRTDLYAVGIMLYEFLVGQPPFVDADAVVVMAKHIREAPLPLCKAAPARPIPRSLELIVSKALEKEPGKRWQSADEFDKALTLCLPEVVRCERRGKRASHDTWLAQLRAAAPTTRTAVLGGLVTGFVLFATVLYVSTRQSGTQATAKPATVDMLVPKAAPEPSASAQAPAAQPVKVAVALQSDPAEAEVWRDDTQLGVTPLSIAVAQGGTVRVSLRKKGFVDHTVDVGASEPTRTVTLSPLPAAPTPADRSARHPRPRRGRATNTGNAGNDTPRTPSADRSSDSPYEKF